MNNSHLQPFDYPLQSDSECESLEQGRAFSHHTSFENEGLTLRPDGYGSLNQALFHPQSLHPASDLDCPPYSPGHDDRFQTGSGVSMSPLTSSRGSSSISPRSTTSSFQFVSDSSYLPDIYCHGSYSSTASSIYSPPLNQLSGFSHSLSNPSKTTSIASSFFSGMPPPSRSSRKPGSVPPSPGTSRERYTIAAHHPARKTHPSYHHNPYHSMHSPHSPRSGVPRNLESPFNRMSSSPGTSYNLANAQLQLESHPSFALGSQNAPPFDNTKVVRQLTDARGIRVVPTIQAQVDKGFFKAEDDWTCYRRNYFSVVCSYSLKGEVDAITEPLSLISQSGQTERIQSLAMCLTAKVSGEDGKAIELVQHTPKRDKGPMGPPEMVELKPHPTGTLGVYPNAGSNIGTGSQTSPDYDPSYPSTSQQSLITANFDRLQFKRATANNGKRRAAQQYFHIVVELFAIISQGSSGQTRSVLVASRCSAPMVVRGRSPGHYQDERRGSSTSMGPGSGSNGEEGARDHSSSGPTGGSYSSMSGVSFSGPGSGKMGTGTYQVHHNSLNRSPSGSLSIPSSNSSSYGSNRSSYIKRHSGSAMSLEEAANIEEHPGYQYYPGALYDLPVNSEPSRPSLPSFRSPQFNSNGQSHSPSHDPFNYPHSSPNKLELHSQSLREDSQRRFQPLQSPSFSNHWHKGPTSDIGGFGRDCRPFQGVASSVGHYPPMSAQL